MSPKAETLVSRLGHKLFPGKTQEEMIQSSEIMATLLQEWNNLPFNVFVRSLDSGLSYAGRKYEGQSLDSDLKLLNGLTTPQVMAPQFKAEVITYAVPDFLLQSVRLKAAKKKKMIEPDVLEDAYIQAEAERQEIWNKENSKRELDFYLNFPQMPLVSSSHYQIPHKFSLFLMLYCISVRETLVRNVLYAYQDWASESELPSYEQIMPFFKDATFVTVGPIHAICTIIHTVRSILASTFGLRARLLPESFGEQRRPSFAFNFAYQKLYKDCFFRNHSQCILEAMGSLSVSKKLIDIYISVASFEKFVDAVEFPTLRISLCPLPILSDMPQGLLPGLPTLNKTLDFLYLHGLADTRPTLTLPKKWAAYVKAKEPVMRLTRELWDASILKLSAWMDGNGTPCFKSIGANKDFEELFSLYFGSFQQAPKYKVDTAMATIFEHINLSSFEKFGSVKASVNMDEATLIFLLSPRLAIWHRDQKRPGTFEHVFPFAQSIQCRLKFSENNTESSLLKRAHKVLQIANKYNLT